MHEYIHESRRCGKLKMITSFFQPKKKKDAAAQKRRREPADADDEDEDHGCMRSMVPTQCTNQSTATTQQPARY